jgi:regulator of protease activity HflC (stomatin/prohibitin superfamily)/Tfp pilus assembly protein PilF
MPAVSRNSSLSALAIFAVGILALSASVARSAPIDDCTKQFGRSAIAPCTLLVDDQNESLGNRALAYLMRARAELDVSDLERAESDISAGLELQPNNVFGYRLRGRLRGLQRRNDDARADYTKALQLSRTPAAKYVSYVERGNFFNRIEDYTDALTDFDAAIHLDGSKASAYVGRAIAYRSTGRIDDASGNLDQAERVEPTYWLTYVERGDILFAQKHYDDAIAAYDLALAQRPTDARAQRGRAAAVKAGGTTPKQVESSPPGFLEAHITNPWHIVLAAVLVLIVVIALSRLRIANQYERAVVFRLGKYWTTRGPGLYWLIPLLEWRTTVDLRTLTAAVEQQETITKDNVPIKVNAVVWYRVIDPRNATLEVKLVDNAVIQVALTTLRTGIGQHSLDDVLKEQEAVSQAIQEKIDAVTEPWGVKVERVEMKNVEIPESMQRAMAQEAEALREKRARLIKAQAELEAAEQLRRASEIIMQNPAGLELRRMQMLTEVGAEQNTMTIVMMPSEFVSMARAIAEAAKPKE